MQTEPKEPYVYQPFAVDLPSQGDRLWGVGGVVRPFDPAVRCKIEGLTKYEAEKVCEALKLAQESEQILARRAESRACGEVQICPRRDGLPTMVGDSGEDWWEPGEFRWPDEFPHSWKPRIHARSVEAAIQMML